jgi:hypothetical protein
MVHGRLPGWQNPFRYFERRSEVLGALTKLLRLQGTDPLRSAEPTATSRPR